MALTRLEPVSLYRRTSRGWLAKPVDSMRICALQANLDENSRDHPTRRRSTALQPRGGRVALADRDLHCRRCDPGAVDGGSAVEPPEVSMVRMAQMDRNHDFPAHLRPPCMAASAARAAPAREYAGLGKA